MNKSREIDFLLLTLYGIIVSLISALIVFEGLRRDDLLFVVVPITILFPISIITWVFLRAIIYLFLEECD